MISISLSWSRGVIPERKWLIVASNSIWNWCTSKSSCKNKDSSILLEQSSLYNSKQRKPLGSWSSKGSIWVTMQRVNWRNIKISRWLIDTIGGKMRKKNQFFIRELIFQFNDRLMFKIRNMKRKRTWEKRNVWFFLRMLKLFCIGRTLRIKFKIFPWHPD